MLLVAKVIGGLTFGIIGLLILLFPRKVYEFDQRLAPFVKSFTIYRVIIWIFIAIPFFAVGVATVVKIIRDSTR